VSIETIKLEHHDVNVFTCEECFTQLYDVDDDHEYCPGCALDKASLSLRKVLAENDSLKAQLASVMDGWRRYEAKVERGNGK